MYTQSKLFFMVCESPLHAGSGSDLDFIDNPIQRERHTGWPKMESSSLKGALRERFREQLSPGNQKNPELDTAFGPDDPKPGQEHQSSLGFTDARLVLFPVKSMKGVFAWITCPAALKRLEQDIRRAEGLESFSIELPRPVRSGQALFFNDALVIGQEDDQNIFLEEYVFEAIPDTGSRIDGEDLNNWFADRIFPDAKFSFWQEEMANKLIILSDDDFTDFVELTTEVITRNKIDPNTGTVESGKLFSEEYLPADTVLYALVMAHAPFHQNGQGKSAEDIMKFFKNNLNGTLKNTFQAGGNATIGKGLLRTCIYVPTKEDKSQELPSETVEQ